MTIRTRLVILLLVIFSAFISMFGIYKKFESHKAERLFRSEKVQEQDNFRRLLDKYGRALTLFVGDYAARDSVSSFLRGEERSGVQQDIDEGLKLFGAQAAWIFDSALSLRYAVGANGLSRFAVLPGGPELFKQVLPDKKSAHFYLFGEGGLWDIRCAAVFNRGDDAEGVRPIGFFVSGRVLDKNYLEDLGRFFSGGEYRIIPADDPDIRVCQESFLPHRITFCLPLPGPQAKPIAVLFADFGPGIFEGHRGNFNSDFWALFLLAFSFSVGIIALFTAGIQRPLVNIGRALKTGNLDKLQRLRSARGEIGDLARLIEEFFHQQRALRASEERYLALVEKASDAVVIVGEEKINFINKAAEKMNGFSSEEAIGKPGSNFITPEYQELAKEKYQQALANGDAGEPYDLEIRTASGGTRRVEVTATVVEYNEAPAVMCVLRDVTERRQMEAQLRQSVERFNDIANNAVEFVWETARDGRYVYCSPVAEKILGYKGEELLGKCFYDFLVPELREKGLQFVRDTVQSPQAFRKLEQKFLHKEGRAVWVSTSAVPILDAAGDLIGYRGVDMDITESKKNEQTLRESEERFRLVTTATSEVVWDWDLITGRVWWNDNFEKLTGYSGADLLPDSDSFFSVIHPNDVERVKKDTQAMMESAHSVWTCEYRVVRKDGSIRHVLDRGCAIRNLQGKAVRLIGVILDITARRDIEEELKINEARFRSLLENLNVGIYRNSPQNDKWIHVNTHCARIFGYDDVEEFKKGFVTDNYVNPDARKFFLREIKEKGAVFNYELYLRRRDGTPFWAEVSARAQFDQSGEILWIDGVVVDISERKRAEARLRVSEERYRSFIDSTSELVSLKDENFKYLVVNAPYMSFMNKTQEEIVGRDDFELMPPEVAENCRKSDSEALRRRGGMVVSEERIGNRIYETRKFAVMLEGRWNIGAYIQDITQRKIAEKAILETEERYRQLVQNIDSIIIQMDMQGNIKFINDFGARFFGYSLEELTGKNVVGTIVPERDTLGQDLKPLMRGIVNDPQAFHNNENENVKKNGERVWISWTNAVVLSKSGEPEILSSGVDITERRRMEEKIRQANSDLQQREQALRMMLADIRTINQNLQRTQNELLERQQELEAQRAREQDLRQKAEAATKAKSEFLAHMSHEVRTPLNAIIGFISLLRKTELNEKQRRFADNANMGSQHLLMIVNDILDLERVATGKLELEFGEFSLRGMVSAVLTLVESGEHVQKLSYSVDDSLPDVFVGDERRLSQVLLNLLNNALKFTPRGEVKLLVQNDGPGREEKHTVLRFIVEDTGIGIPKDRQGIIFDAFSQADSSLTRQHGGVGLGLAIVAAYVDLMKGKVWVESEAQKGSKFFFTVELEIRPSE